jgi:L-gulonolactone oxidase
VTVQVGKKLEDLNTEIWNHGLAMSDLSDIAYQSVAGAISTGTHGTGIGFGCLATQVIAARVISGEGEIIDCSPEKDPDLFGAAVIGVGSAGILSTVTLQLEDAFNLHALEMPMPFEFVIDNQDQFVADNEHFEYFCHPDLNVALTKRNNRTSQPGKSLSSFGRWYHDEFIAGYLPKLTRLAKQAFPQLSKYLTHEIMLVARDNYIDRSYSVFTSERKQYGCEMEYFIPRENAKEALERVLDFIKKSGLKISMPIEVRWSGADEFPISMCYGRETTSIAVHVEMGERYENYFVPVETIMMDYDGRPHWGKMHFQTSATLAPLYPKWDEFQKARRILDPKGIFENDYTKRVFGPI